MPSYDYRCNVCGHRFEKTQRITEAAAADCPSCGDAGCERLITGGTFHLKGGGWHASDYKAKAAAEPACETAKPAGGCGLAQCGTGACAAMAESA